MTWEPSAETQLERALARIAALEDAVNNLRAATTMNGCDAEESALYALVPPYCQLHGQIVERGCRYCEHALEGK